MAGQLSPQNMTIANNQGADWAERNDGELWEAVTVLNMINTLQNSKNEQQCYVRLARKFVLYLSN